MAWNKLIGIMASGALVGVVAFAGNGCSSSSSSGATGTTDSGTHHDSGSSSGGSGSSSGSSSGGGDDSGDDSGGGSYDGTTGKACTSDADCHTATGPGVNKCTNDVLFTGGALFPSPVCFMPAMCDPLANGADSIAFCDGDPTSPASPGVCLPTTNPAATGMGICLPQCNFKPDGSAATGCVGKDTCDIYGIGSDASGNPLGIGYCYGGCDTDADCTSAGAGQHCQSDEGLCLTNVTVDSPAGTGCTSSATTSTCNCIANTSTNLGYCGQFCKTGGTECPSGWICDVQLPTTLTNSADAEVAGWTMNNPGMAGFCAPSCTGDAGHTQLDSGSCPANSSCQAGDVGGPDCLP